jgi:protein phosphatase PTC2/3
LESISKNAKALPPFEKSKVIIKKFGHIQAFAVNTHQGTVRSYNEDRVSILLNA